MMKGDRMNKADLIEAVASAADLSRTAATQAVESVFSSLVDAMRRGDKVAIAGFGTFEVGDRAARTGRNPRTGEEIKIPASKQARFKAAKGLKDALN